MHGLRKNADAMFFGTAIFLLIIGFSLYYVKLADIEGHIVIHYLAGRGADFLGGKHDALAMLFSGVILTSLNTCLAGILYYRNPVLARITGMITVFNMLLILIALLCIIIVN